MFGLQKQKKKKKRRYTFLKENILKVAVRERKETKLLSSIIKMRSNGLGLQWKDNV